MNTSILKRALDELSKETPDISYVRGMLETLIEINPTPMSRQLEVSGGKFTPLSPAPGPQPKDEGTLLDIQAKAQLAKTMEMVQKSSHD